MRALGPEERRHWLGRMRELIARYGATAFVAAPLLEPTDRFFPDAYTPDVPPLDPGGYYRVWVDGEPVLSFIADGSSSCSGEPSASFPRACG